MLFLDLHGKIKILVQVCCTLYPLQLRSNKEDLTPASSSSVVFSIKDPNLVPEELHRLNKLQEYTCPSKSFFEQRILAELSGRPDGNKRFMETKGAVDEWHSYSVRQTTSTVLTCAFSYPPAGPT